MRTPRTIAPLFTPALVLPDQLARPPRCWRGSGERALMFAVLEDAVRCLAWTRGGGRVARRAEAWITSRDRTWPFSFVNVCEALDLDPAALRAGLLATRARRPPGSRLRLRRCAGVPSGRVVAPRLRTRRPLAARPG